jgi:hypothetical protein
MNEEEQRNYLIHYHQQKTKTKNTHKWLGTWHVRQDGKDNALYFVKPTTLKEKSFDQFFKKKKSIFSRYDIVLFHVCLFYEENKVHYVAFFWIQGQLISFDPGISFYPEGQKIIVPHIERQFEKMSTDTKCRRLGVCKNLYWKNKKTGVQYNEKRALFPADSFCQSWTLFFTIRVFYLSITEIETVLSQLCKIPPKHREFYLVSMFIFPTLLYHNAFLSQFVQSLTITMPHYDSFSILSSLWKDLDRCFPK